MADHEVNICNDWNGNQGNKVTFTTRGQIASLAKTTTTPGRLQMVHPFPRRDRFPLEVQSLPT